MKYKLFCLYIIVFSISYMPAQEIPVSKARILVDALVQYGEISNTTQGVTLMFYDIDSTMPYLEFVNTNSIHQMHLIDSVCTLFNKDTLHCYRFGLFGTHQYFHFALLYRDTLYAINMRQSLDIVIKEIYMVIHRLNINTETILSIFKEAINVHYTNSVNAQANVNYNPLKPSYDD